MKVTESDWIARRLEREAAAAWCEANIARELAEATEAAETAAKNEVAIAKARADVVAAEAAMAAAKAAWDSLFAWLWRWSVRITDSEDYAMNGWVVALRSPQCWRSESLKLLAWLMSKRRADKTREEWRRQKLSARLKAAGPIGVPIESNSELRLLVEQALEGLSVDKRDVLELYFEGHDTNDIAHMLGKEPERVRFIVRQTRASLRRVFTGLRIPVASARELRHNSESRRPQ